MFIHPCHQEPFTRFECIMLLSDLFVPEAVFAQLRTPTRGQTLALLTAALARRCGVDERRALDMVLERERLGSTAMGNGIAIPHGKLDGVARTMVGFGRLTVPNDFDALDGQPVDLVCVMLGPPEGGADHLKALASLSRLLRDRALVAKLRGCETNDALYALLTGENSSVRAA